jgi:hypothetical protein
MNSGLTIAFICSGKKHDTVENYKNFGKKYWDDTHRNNSKIGYYFAYYFQQKYVYIHKIIDILPPNKRPADMNWTSNRQILCLSNQLKTYTWNEWINGIGFGAPYTPNYRMTQTCSYSYNEMLSHVKYCAFKFLDFKNIIENQTITNNVQLIIKDDEEEEYDEDDDDEEVILMREMEAERNALLLIQEKKLKEIKERKMRANIQPLRDEVLEVIQIRMEERLKQIKTLQTLQDADENEIATIKQGGKDEELIKKRFK